MARKKVQLSYITNDTARKETFKKRKKGLMKKVMELSTLCGLSACAILYSPYDSQPVIWPPTEETQQVLERFKSMSEIEQSKKKMNQEEFLKQTIAKVKDQLKKQQKDNRDMEMEDLMYQILAAGKGLHEVNIENLSDLTWVVDKKLKEIHEMMEELRKNAEITEPEKMPLAMAVEAMQMQPWFMELMNQQEEMGPVPDEMTLPYGDDSTCFDALFP